LALHILRADNILRIAQKHFAYAHNIRYVMLCYVLYDVPWLPSASQDITLREITSWCHSMKLKRCRLLTFLLLLSTFLFLCFSSSLLYLEVALLFMRFLI